MTVDFVRADVTRLSRTGIGADFELIVDNGCLHNMSDDDRAAYVRAVSAYAEMWSGPAASAAASDACQSARLSPGVP